LYKKLLNKEISNRAYIKKADIIKIIINNKEIQLLNHENTINEHTLCGSVLDSCLMYIANIMLGNDILE